MLFGKDLVVFGAGFKGGTGYSRLTLTQFNDDKDVGELTAKDLDGDGGAELIVRGTRHVKADAQTGRYRRALRLSGARRQHRARVLDRDGPRGVRQARARPGAVHPGKGRRQGFDMDVRPWHRQRLDERRRTRGSKTSPARAFDRANLAPLGRHPKRAATQLEQDSAVRLKPGYRLQTSAREALSPLALVCLQPDC